MSPPARQVLGWALAFALVSGVALGQKDLHWKALNVSARLDADGRLHVVERHHMVFTGDWNGGERSFRVEPGQSLSVEAMRRIDRDGNVIRDLVRGDTNAVDHFDFTDKTTLRWRSRLPSDPPFDNTELGYEIDYTLSGVLLKQADRYVLDHNFALPAANKRIESLTVDLDLDPAWTPPPGSVSHRTAGPLEPGANYVVHAELGRASGTAPAGVRT